MAFHHGVLVLLLPASDIRTRHIIITIITIIPTTLLPLLHTTCTL
jgi:hypothetical protein